MSNIDFDGYGFFLLVQIFNQEMQKSPDFGTESLNMAFYISYITLPEIMFLLFTFFTTVL